MKEARQKSACHMILFILAPIRRKPICHYRQIFKRAEKKVYDEWYSGS